MARFWYKKSPVQDCLDGALVTKKVVFIRTACLRLGYLLPIVLPPGLAPL